MVCPKGSPVIPLCLPAFDYQPLLLTKASHGLLEPVQTLLQPKCKNPKWCHWLSSPRKQSQNSCFYLFICTFDSRVPAVSGRVESQGESLCACRLQSCDFLSCASQATGLTQEEASKYSCKDYRRWVTLPYAPGTMNKCCLWTSAKTLLSDHGGLTIVALLKLLRCEWAWFVCISIHGSNMTEWGMAQSVGRSTNLTNRLIVVEYIALNYFGEVFPCSGLLNTI